MGFNDREYVIRLGRTEEGGCVGIAPPPPDMIFDEIQSRMEESVTITSTSDEKATGRQACYAVEKQDGKTPDSVIVEMGCIAVSVLNENGHTPTFDARIRSISDIDSLF
ncbi:hypothetical protein HGB25_03280 [Candidatus Saccharibacteria bacterium]|nr:hypothetical protein [Candidatus Saccharibacteria bacterium]